MSRPAAYSEFMTIPAKPKAVLFDAYGTLFDVHSVSVRADSLFSKIGEGTGKGTGTGKGAALSLLWREKQIDYTRLRTMSEPNGAHYKPFWEITRDALRFACKRLELPLSADAEAALMEAYKQLSPFPENRGVLEQLNARGIATGVLSNGDPQMLKWSIASAGFNELLQHCLSADAVRKFKTAPEAYALGTAALGLPAEEIVFVSSNCWDACAATWFGYTTLWVNRAGLPLDELGVQPHRIGRDLADVLEFFD